MSQTPPPCQRKSSHIMVRASLHGWSGDRSEPPGTTMANIRQKDYLIWSIVSMVCCCCPLGLAALIFSVKSRNSSNENDSDGAVKHSRTSFQLNIAALVVGIIMIIIVIVYSIVIRSKVHA
ncbi:hypothetical protein GDO81_021682 [Engystomops pustulosus]|uniref:Uncharacterized protein n=1 Tax=Engystomops pustulosus TaxID=76066 RepID=A0AAV6ZBV7_ENGPU|nr:hypothetical protein GDO81_021682 [Engystomops pustulosus]